MIEGVAIVPWFNEAVERSGGTLPIASCDSCLGRYDQATRQRMACPYEPKDPAIEAEAWKHDAYRGPDPIVCPGFTTRLPIVEEVINARRHWKQNGLRDFCEGETPTRELVDCVDLLEIHVNALSAWRMKPAKEGGGGA